MAVSRNKRKNSKKQNKNKTVNAQQISTKNYIERMVRRQTNFIDTFGNLVTKQLKSTGFEFDGKDHQLTDKQIFTFKTISAEDFNQLNVWYDSPIEDNPAWNVLSAAEQVQKKLKSAETVGVITFKADGNCFENPIIYQGRTRLTLSVLTLFDNVIDMEGKSFNVPLTSFLVTLLAENEHIRIDPTLSRWFAYKDELQLSAVPYAIHSSLAAKLQTEEGITLRDLIELEGNSGVEKAKEIDDFRKNMGLQQKDTINIITTTETNQIQSGPHYKVEPKKINKAASKIIPINAAAIKSTP